ncbi:MAG: hypothetical protein J6Y78_15340 [Paludibacteraceae bacterium]|nr:hypothetical protein [Paludibacteraceae bacterium]
MADKQIKDWITINGVHIPIYEGEDKNDAFNRAVKEKVKADEDKKNRDIQKNQSEADERNQKKASDFGASGGIKESLSKKEVNAKNEKWFFKEMSKAIKDKSLPENRAYFDIPDKFADYLFDKYDPSDIYIYLTQKERNSAYKDMQGIGANSKQIQMEWKKKAIWRLAKAEAWDDLEEW